jgi:hypothetical protein
VTVVFAGWECRAAKNGRERLDRKVEGIEALIINLWIRHCQYSATSPGVPRAVSKMDGVATRAATGVG